jgi:hypothetical protein
LKNYIISAISPGGGEEEEEKRKKESRNMLPQPDHKLEVRGPVLHHQPTMKEGPNHHHQLIPDISIDEDENWHLPKMNQ